MMHGRRSKTAMLMAMAIVMCGLAQGCPVWRTEHKVETTHKIEAHIVIDIRQEANAIENEVRGEAPKAESDEESPISMIGGLLDHHFRPQRTIWAIFDPSTVAMAQSGDEKAAIDRRKARAGAINKALTKGCLGENQGGYVEARPCNASAAEKKQNKALADAENKDRKVVYGALAVRRGLKASQADAIGFNYAASIREKLKKGQPFQVPAADPFYDSFKASSLGKRFGGAKKGEWVKF